MKLSNQIIQQLTSKLEIERIYQFTYYFPDQDYHHLLIVLNSKCGVSPATLEPTVDMCLEEAKEFTYTIIPSGQLNAILKGANLFYTIVCQEQNLCYHDGKKPIPNISKEELELIKVKSGNHFYSSQKRAAEFTDGMVFYRKKGNAHQAAFMLHQSAEQSIRGVLHAVFNKDKPGHSLQAHLKTISCFIPVLASLFPKDSFYEYGLLQQLDNAYTSVQNRKDYVIEEHDLDLLSVKIELLLVWFKMFYTDCLKTLEELIIKEEERKNMVQPILNSKPLNESVHKEINPSNKLNVLNTSQKSKLDTLIDKICKQHPVSQILALGVNTSAHQNNSIYRLEQIEEQSAHCYLLVILKGHQEVRSYTSYQGDLKVTMLIHHEKEITYALSKHNRFFIQSLKTGIEIYKCVEDPIQFIVPKADWKHSLKSADYFFKNGLEWLAEKFLESARHIYEELDFPATEASLLLLTHCIEQVCISYIYINIGYRINNHNLPFLFDLCGLVNADSLNILHQDTTVGKRQKEALINCVQHLRNKSKCNLGHGDFVILLERCKDLIELVKRNCQTELDSLRKLAHPEEVSKKLLN